MHAMVSTTAIPLEHRPATTHDDAPQGRRLLPLDGVRGLAILLILVHHFVPPLFPTLLGRWAGRFIASSWFGVDLFFVLSGFLITGILFDAKGRPHFFRNFYARRTFRVFPLYYGVLILTCLLLPALLQLPLHWASQTWLWLYGTNLYPLWHGSFYEFPSALGLQYAHFWSLAVEEHFYLVWPLVVFLFGRRSLMWISGGLVVLAFVLRVVYMRAGYSPDVLYHVTWLRMDGLAAGGWIALAVRGAGGTRRLVLPAICVAAISGIAVAFMFFREGGLYRGNWDVQVAGYSCLAIFFAAMIPPIVAPGGNLLQTALSAPILRFFGRYSYGMYVFHGMLIPYFQRLAFGGPRFGPWIYATIAITGTVGISFISFHVYERQFLRLKKFFEARPVQGRVK